MPENTNNASVLPEREKLGKNQEFMFLMMKFGIVFSETTHYSRLYEILLNLDNDGDLNKGQLRWLCRNKLYNVVALFCEREYSKNRSLHNATNAFRFWFKAGDTTKSEKFANLLLLETLSLEDEVLRKSRRYYEVEKYTYDDYLASDLWKITQTIAKKRARGKCQVCNSSEHLQVHHRSYEDGLGKESVTDLTVLCRDCHKLFHDNLKKRLLNDLKQG